MDNREQNNNREYYSIDLLHILKRLWQRAWLVALAGFLAAAVGFSIAKFAVTPMYSSSIMLYVNNNSISLGNTSVTFSASELTAAQSLVKTYIVMLKNRTTLEAVINKADVDYTYSELNDMISATDVDETEVMRIKVTCDDPYIAAKIANSIAEVLPSRLSEIIEGSSMEVVDSAIPDLNKVSPSVTKYTAVGFMLGILVSVIFISIGAIMDNTVHDEEYVLQTYNYPILAKIPNLLDAGNKRYGYYYRYRKYKTPDTGTEIEIKDEQEGR